MPKWSALVVLQFTWVQSLHWIITKTEGQDEVRGEKSKEKSYFRASDYSSQVANSSQIAKIYVPVFSEAWGEELKSSRFRAPADTPPQICNDLHSSITYSFSLRDSHQGSYYSPNLGVRVFYLHIFVNTPHCMLHRLQDHLNIATLNTTVNL